MDNLNVIDRFMQVFIRYIDSGFGLLSGDVAALTSILVVIDVTLAALFWLLDGEANVLAQLVRKTLYVGSFAFILNNFSTLADAIFASFSTLGLRVTNNGLSPQDLLRPGRLAGVGFQAAWPLLQQAGSQVGFTNILANFAIMLVLLFAWVVVVLSFFILAVQLFVTVIEFKLSTLAGFVLVPFALWTKTAFLAERALGHVVASGIKVMVLAVIVGIGASLFGDFTNALQGPVTLSQAMSLVLASIALFGLGIFGPGIAAGLVSGGPQLGAGAAVGTASALASSALLVGGTAWSAARLAGVGSLTSVLARRRPQAAQALRAARRRQERGHLLQVAASPIGRASCGPRGVAGRHEPWPRSCARATSPARGCRSISGSDPCGCSDAPCSAMA
jgi:type IV secretion system protein TrbL